MTFAHMARQSAHCSSYTHTATLSNSAMTAKARGQPFNDYSPQILNSTRMIGDLDTSVCKPRQSLANDPSLSTSPMRGLSRSNDILKSELQMAKAQLKDARNSYNFLKKEKQNAEAERDLAIREVNSLKEMMAHKE